MTELATRPEIEAAFWDPVRTVITSDGWKYNHSPRGEHELYNLRDDPFETQNLALEFGYNAVTARLTKEIGKWQHATGDTVTPAGS
jgi:hypothetical protein